MFVIGSGSSAMDCARTAIRQGARYVTVFNRRDKIAASQYESSYAKLEGVNFEMMKTPVEILDDCVVFADSEFDEEGKLHTVPGSEKRYPCTGVIVAVSQELGSSIMNSAKDIQTKQTGLLIADEDGRTSRPGVYAAGDAAHGARTVVEAVANGKRVAETMHAYMQSLPMPEPSPYANVPKVEAVEASVMSEQVIG
jgi:glutamate synthase (NADPH/NADH) small chain